MAKFERYDPRNKKKDRNKNKSLDQETRIKVMGNDNKLPGFKLNEVMYDEYEGLDEDPPQQLNG